MKSIRPLLDKISDASVIKNGKEKMSKGLDLINEKINENSEILSYLLLVLAILLIVFVFLFLVQIVLHMNVFGFHLELDVGFLVSMLLLWMVWLHGGHKIIRQLEEEEKSWWKLW